MQDFRNLKVWEKSHALTLDIYRVTLVFSERRALWIDEPDAPFVGVDSDKPR